MWAQEPVAGSSCFIRGPHGRGAHLSRGWTFFTSWTALNTEEEGEMEGEVSGTAGWQGRGCSPLHRPLSPQGVKWYNSFLASSLKEH